MEENIMRISFFKRVVTLALAATLALTLIATVQPIAPNVKDVQSLGMFSVSKWTVHYRAPNTDQIETLLEKEGIPLPSTEARTKAVQVFRQEWAKRNPTTPNPRKLEELLNKERTANQVSALSAQAAEATTPQIMSLAVPVEFPNSDTFDWCGESVTTEGPLHNQIPPPGPRDNNTIWYQDATPALYNELYFGVGPKAGVIVQHPNLGAVDLRGNTMANFYLEQSDGKFQPKGEVYPKWLQAAHSEGWYGADNCTGSNHNVLAGDLVREVVDGVNVDDPSFAWQNYDGNADGVVDNFTVIHAGMGQEAGGGQQGDFSIWSHASAIDYPTGKLACAMGSAGCPDRDIFVREYSMDPEALDVGVISEEFGHAAFGLPDIYTTDAQASPSNWAIMEAGSWNGPLGGMQPAPFPLYFRYLIGWAKPLELNYTAGPTVATVRQLSTPPKDDGHGGKGNVPGNMGDEHGNKDDWKHQGRTEQGIKINLPDTVVDTPNRAGTGNGWWSDRADLADFYLAHDFDLTTAAAPVFSFASYWSFEADYDYGYIEVSTDGGTTWTKVPDMDGIFVDDGSGNLGLNGEGQGTLRFDLAAYAGKPITLRLHYTSDVGVQWAGWWADDFLLVDGAATLFTDDVENPPNGWTTNNFVIVPLTRTYPVYYMAEWRNASGFDKGLAYPYTTIYNDPTTTEWQVDRCPYTVPGMLLWLRNGAQDFDYTLYDSLYDPPSYGPKHALLVVDSHYWPLEWEGMGTSEAHLRLNSRCQPGNATFTLQDTTPYTVRRADAAGAILETKTFAPLPGVSQFHDSLGYYPGLRYRPANGGLYFWDAAASLVVPAQGNYTTKITNGDKTPATDLYGIDLGDTILGSGNPGDAAGQYGLHLAVVDKAKDGTWGKIAVWNSPALFKADVKVDKTQARPGQLLTYMVMLRNTTPASQSFVLDAPIPANTTFVHGMNYDAAKKSIHLEGKLPPYGMWVVGYIVKVTPGTPGGTVITNQVAVTDGALGASASATTTIKSR
jgi:immune inhibitor A